MSDSPQIASAEKQIVRQFPQLTEVPAADRRVLFIATLTGAENASQYTGVSKKHIERMLNTYGKVFEELSRDEAAVRMLDNMLTLYMSFQVKMKAWAEINKPEAEAHKVKRWTEVLGVMKEVGVQEQREIRRLLSEREGDDVYRKLTKGS